MACEAITSGLTGARVWCDRRERTHLCVRVEQPVSGHRLRVPPTLEGLRSAKSGNCSHFVAFPRPRYQTSTENVIAARAVLATRAVEMRATSDS